MNKQELLSILSRKYDDCIYEEDYADEKYKDNKYWEGKASGILFAIELLEGKWDILKK